MASILVNFLIDIAYAFCLAFVVEKFDERKNGVLSFVKPIFLAVLIMIIFLGCISSKVFLKGVMSFSGIRENSTDARWSYIEKSDYSKLPKNISIHGLKLENDSHYFCSYSTFNYGDYTVLCPFDVVEGDSASCLIFEAKKVRPVPAPKAMDWICHPPEKKRL